MKILVIDDKPTQIAAAKAQLEGHELVTTDSADKALVLLGEEEGDRTRECDFDVVLTDLMMPAPRQGLGNQAMQEYVWSETPPLIPAGIFFALMAAKNGVKYVGLLTDTNHHNHPASALLDAFLGGPMSIDGAKVVMTNSHFFLETQKAEGSDPQHPSQIKRWDKLLTRLLEE